MQAGIELGIGPHGLQFGGTDAVGVGRLLEIHGALDRREPARPLVGLAVARPDDIEDLLEALAVLASSP